MRLLLIAVVAPLWACVIDEPEPAGKQCSSSHPCPEDYVCQPATSRCARRPAWLLTFDELKAPSPLSGEYPTGVVSWAPGFAVAAPWKGLQTPNLGFSDASVRSASFTLLDASHLVRLEAFNGGAAPSVLTLRCAGLPEVVQTLEPNVLTAVETGWAERCTDVTLSSGNGWDTNFDNLALD